MNHLYRPRWVYYFTIFLFAWVVVVSCKREEKEHQGWEVTGGTKEGMRYSSLTEIDTNNVYKLQKAWEYHTGDADTANHSQIQCNPIVVHGVLYGTSPKLKLFAVDAETGKERWVFNPVASSAFFENPATNFILNNNRGVAYWENENGGEQRILYAAGSYLFAVDAKTGEAIVDFGTKGIVDLHDGLETDAEELYVSSTSPGVIYNDLIIMGTRVSENSDAAPGHVRAYDVRTGEQRWIFHTIPQPGEFGYKTWEDPEAWKHVGGANSWSGFTLDEKRGIVFVPTGSASFDFYGGMRKGDNLFANCVLALDAATGKYIWHFQTVHHDVWDRDHPTPPALVSVTVDGKQVDAVAQPTKSGFIFLLDRETGKPLYRVEERGVPGTTQLDGEKLSATQPFPTFPQPFTRQNFAEEEINDLVSDSSRSDLLRRYRSASYEGIFTPMSEKGTIVFPGLDGGAEWGGPAFDPGTGIMYVNANEMPWMITMVKMDHREVPEESYFEAGKRLYQLNCISCHGPELKGGGNYPSLIEAPEKFNLDSLRNMILYGRRMMPAFQHLKENEIRAISSFVLTLDEMGDERYLSSGDQIDAYRKLPYTITGYNKFLSKEGYPAIKPPWGTLNAVNLNTGEVEWRIPLGQPLDFAGKGIVTGTENYGGPVVTAGGLIFIAASADEKIRAFHKRTGELLWEHELPASGFATPAVYEIDGRQFVVIACGGGKLGTQSGDSYVAFSLTE